MPFGFVFSPTDAELMEDYLLPKLKGKKLPSNYIVDLKDVYQYDPDHLPYRKFFKLWFHLFKVCICLMTVCFVLRAWLSININIRYRVVNNSYDQEIQFYLLDHDNRSLEVWILTNSCVGCYNWYQPFIFTFNLLSLDFDSRILFFFDRYHE